MKGTIIRMSMALGSDECSIVLTFELGSLFAVLLFRRNVIISLRACHSSGAPSNHLKAVWGPVSRPTPARRHFLLATSITLIIRVVKAIAAVTMATIRDADSIEMFNTSFWRQDCNPKATPPFFIVAHSYRDASQQSVDVNVNLFYSSANDQGDT